MFEPGFSAANRSSTFSSTNVQTVPSSSTNANRASTTTAAVSSSESSGQAQTTSTVNSRVSWSSELRGELLRAAFTNSISALR